ncbi:1-acyl-sn-glycerol-3-phosphate acyltransferase [Erythrobacteraceae bacterium E2-1 Yellow Sea]|nr:1-acyl-sn-glycerol-3-phosphate acyltransferase [Erythrobacteraceae bacterium E2-1 Yellow Sea]
MNVIRSLIFYLLFYSVSIFHVLGSVLAIPFSTRLLWAAVRGWAQWHRWCVTHILGIDIVMEGDVPDGPTLFVGKHESFFEAIDAPALHRDPSVFAKQELFSIPGWGRAAHGYGLIPVARDQGAKTLRNMLSNAREKVADGRPLVIFPEGTRVPHGERRPLLSGFAGIYKLLGLPVVPVAVNSGPLYHRKWKKRGTIIYRFGEVIPPGLPRDEVEARVHAAINALND